MGQVRVAVFAASPSDLLLPDVWREDGGSNGSSTRLDCSEYHGLRFHLGPASENEVLAISCLVICNGFRCEVVRIPLGTSAWAH